MVVSVSKDLIGNSQGDSEAMQAAASYKAKNQHNVRVHDTDSTFELLVCRCTLRFDRLELPSTMMMVS